MIKHEQYVKLILELMRIANEDELPNWGDEDKCRECVASMLDRAGIEVQR